MGRTENSTCSKLKEKRSINQYSYSEGSKALDDINLSIREGEFLAIIGENGSGKTTLLRHLNGLLTPSGGDLFIAGENTKDTDTYHLSQKIGYVFQNPDHQIFSSTVEEEITFGLRQRSLREEEIQKRVGRAMEIAGLK